MGCPLVALCGETFAARVSASIVSAAGFPDLVTHSLEEYEALAFRLATDRTALDEIRSRLSTARREAPLFDSHKFARDLEDLYRTVTRN
jgi:predicted O-linked N-acetylglucosamine transferase (SPINDLY family)